MCWVRTKCPPSFVAICGISQSAIFGVLAGDAINQDDEADEAAANNNNSDNEVVDAEDDNNNEERNVQRDTGRRPRGSQISTREFYAFRLQVREMCAWFEDNKDCPITQMPMEDPVVTADGHTYDRAAIERWLQTHDTSPLTNEVLSTKRLSADGCAHQRHTNDRNPIKLDDALNRWGRLFQEYCCMSLAKTEQQKLRFLQHNQKTIRAELYSGLHDAVRAHDQQSGSAGELQVGQKVILPASFTGGPRDQNRRYQDAMAIVRRLGKPSLFITMTCNPQWPEIVRNLPPGHKAENRPDLVARVFKLKLDRLLHELLKDNIFGRPTAHLHVIEFQHRGLPHAHILLILADNCRFLNPDDVDSCVTAELPVPPTPLADDASDAERAEYEAKKARFDQLTELVCTHMTHGPCGDAHLGAPCMDSDGECKKKFPRAFVDETVFGEQGQIYPTLRRRAPETVCCMLTDSLSGLGP